MTMIGLYRPGTSLVHRLSARWKLLLMFAAILGLLTLHRPWQLGGAALVVAGAYALAGIPARVVLRQLWPLRWLLLIIAVLQLVINGWASAVLVCGGLLISMAIAALVTLTTRVTDILDVCQQLLRPLSRLGIDPDRIGLVLAMTIRCIPVVADIVDQVSQARKARALGFSVIALVVPVVVRALRSADAMGDALIARGFDD